MARGDILRSGFPGARASTGQLLTFTTGDTVNGHRIKWTGKEALIARNSGATPHTVTVASAPDPYGRIGDITAFNVPAGGEAVFGPWDVSGWAQTDGYINVNVNHAEMLLAVLLLP